ncbi:MAG: hypothetical protein OEN56_02735 [Gemmatimonadota bacterium]|nr:hypothetical protein [Gemmatimonadota bacterium]
MRRRLRSVGLLSSLLILASCSANDFIIVRPELTTYIARITVDGIKADFVGGSPPVPGAGPTVTTPTNTQVITGGSTQVDLLGSGAYQTVAIQVEGVAGYYLVVLPETKTLAQMVITLGGLVPRLDFDFLVAVAGTDGVFGPWSRTSMTAIQVAGGDIQVSVTWDTEADVDLHVIDPAGNEIYFGNRTAGGGELDLDANAACSTSAIFQENIGWASGEAQSGAYIVRVEYWDACGAVETNYVVTVSLRPGVPVIPGTPGASVQTFEGSFVGSGTQGGAGSGRFITNFTF